MADLQTRTKVLDAAATLFDEHGFAIVTIADLSARSGVSNGSIYHHFGSKDGVLTSLLVAHATALQERLLQVLDNHPDDSRGCVQNTVAAYLGWTENHRSAAKLLAEHGLAFRTGAARPTQRALNDRYEQASGDWLRSQIAAGRLPTVTVPVAHAIVFAPAREICRVWLGHDDFPPPTTFTRPLAEAAWAGLTAATPDGEPRGDR